MNFVDFPNQKTLVIRRVFMSDNFQFIKHDWFVGPIAEYS